MSKQKPQEQQAPVVEQKPVVETQVVETETTTAASEVVVETPKEEAPVAPAPVMEEIAKPASVFTEDALKIGPTHSRLYDLFISQIKNYSKTMAAGIHHVPAVGARHQAGLNDTYQLLFKLTPPEVRDALDETIALFKENEHGAFSEGHLFRWPEHVALSAPNLRAFNHFSHLLLSAASVGKAEAGRLCDMGSFTGWCPSEEARQLLVNYFR